MFQYMENLTPGQAEEVKRTIQDLFRQTCILQIKYDPVTLLARENPKYHSCTKHREFISDYLPAGRRRRGTVPSGHRYNKAAFTVKVYLPG